MIPKFAIRNLLRRPLLNLIKVVGLGLALSGILIIVLFLKNELTFDSFHTKSNRIYRFTLTSPGFFEGEHFARVYKPDFIPKMPEYFPEIENYVRLIPVLGGPIKVEENFIKVNQAFQCDSTFFDLFESELLVGNPEKILDNPGSMVVSESFAKRVFGSLNPIGQILTLPGGQYYGENIDFTVNGVMKDFPQNSHFHPEFIATPGDKNEFDRWAWTYLLLSENADPDNISSGFKNFYSSHIENKTIGVEVEAHLQVISKIHLHSNKLREIEPNGSMSTIYTLSIAALILLVIAMTNYSNLNIGMADFSEKYLFISKVSGSSVWMNLGYFVSQGIIIVVVSFAIGGFMATLANILIQKYFALNLFKGNTPLILTTVLLFGLSGILSGVLPFLKQGISNLKLFSGYDNKTILKRKGASKSIIVIQYTISIALIVAVIVIRRQTSYALKSSMGANDNNLICFEDVHSSVQAKFGVFKEEMLKFNSIKSVSAMFEPPGGEANDMFEFKMDGYIRNETNNADNYIGIFPCDYSFASIFNLNFLAGNNFSEKNQDNESSGEYIINESAMRRLHYTDPYKIIGREFGLISNIGGVNIPSGKIIGVVRNFHLSSLKKEIEPLVLFKREDLWLINILVSFKEGMRTTALADIKSLWTTMFPEYPFQYLYVSSMYKNVYRTELLQAKLLSIFTFIAIFICSMGLLGLSLLMTQRRTKEIGIRKINGARISEIILMLNWDLIKWIVISFIIAIPLAYFLMNKWLESFAYRIIPGWWVFTLAGLTAMLIAILTVSVQSWKAANRNPVEALRYE